MNTVQQPVGSWLGRSLSEGPCEDSGDGVMWGRGWLLDCAEMIDRRSMNVHYMAHSFGSSGSIPSCISAVLIHVHDKRGHEGGNEVLQPHTVEWRCCFIAHRSHVAVLAKCFVVNIALWHFLVVTLMSDTCLYGGHLDISCRPAMER